MVLFQIDSCGGFILPFYSTILFLIFIFSVSLTYQKLSDYEFPLLSRIFLMLPLTNKIKITFVYACLEASVYM